MGSVLRDTIMRLGVRVGEACKQILDAKMRGLNCSHIEVDELWGFIGKKQARTSAIDPNPSRVCTSYIERANLTVRTHCKRLARLTLAFSKKFENFKSAIALHFAYYNFVKTHGSLRCTPAMEAGIANSA